MYAYYIDYAMESERDKEREGVKGGQILRMGGGLFTKGKSILEWGYPRLYSVFQNIFDA